MKLKWIDCGEEYHVTMIRSSYCLQYISYPNIGKKGNGGKLPHWETDGYSISVSTTWAFKMKQWRSSKTQRKVAVIYLKSLQGQNSPDFNSKCLIFCDGNWDAPTSLLRAHFSPGIQALLLRSSPTCDRRPSAFVEKATHQYVVGMGTRCKQQEHRSMNQWPALVSQQHLGNVFASCFQGH